MPKIRYLKTQPSRSLSRIALSIVSANLLLLALVAAALVLTSCGPARVINSGCGGDLRGLCDAVFGPVDRQDELAEASEQQASELESLRRQVQQLESDMRSLEDEMATEVALLEDTLNLSLSELQIYVDAATGQLREDLDAAQSDSQAADADLRSLIERNRVRINRALRRIRQLRSGLDDALSDIATLQGYPNIVRIHDPCGPSGGFDEVVLELADGTYLAYFEQGTRRFLSLLAPGQYRTTDASACAFNIPITN